MDGLLATLLDRLGTHDLSERHVLDWGSPVPAFGDPRHATLATVGLNPSNREFLDELGQELSGPLRRFPTLTSLELRSWDQADSRDLMLIRDACVEYFLRNPYDRWFKIMEILAQSAGLSYYAREGGACHLDMVPFATRVKWTMLSSEQRAHLVDTVGDTLGRIVRDSTIRVLVLNGQSIVSHFTHVAHVEWRRRQMLPWTLPRKSRAGVAGVAYSGQVTSIAGVDLGRECLVLGYNHNLQSSFGVTRAVISSIGRWIGKSIRENEHASEG